MYIDKAVNGFLLTKTLKHELMHVYLWDTGQQGHDDYNEEEVCDLLSAASEPITTTVNEILLRLKEGLYNKYGE